METEVLMPKVGAQMTEATIVNWLVEVGQKVEEGDPILEIQTDKITMEVEAETEGYLLKKMYEDNETVPVQTPIAYIGKEKNDELNTDNQESPGLEDTYSETTFDNENIRRTPLARNMAERLNIDLKTVQGSGPKGRIQKADIEMYSVKDNRQTKVTPLANNIAKVHDVDVNDISGSGDRGKIKKSDILEAVSKNKESNLSTSMEENEIPFNGLRKAVADSMSYSATNSPHVTLHSEIDMTEAVDLRKRLIPLVEDKEGLRISINDIVMKAVGISLQKHPEINISLNETEDKIIEHTNVNLGMAVAIQGGLIVPVIQDINKKSISLITKETKDLAERSAKGQLTGEEMKGSTFTVSNLGRYAINQFTPIINPPNAAILGVGQIKEAPVVKEGKIVIREMMAISLSFDHRILDGAPAAAFVTTLKMVLEDPFKIVI